MPTMTRPSVPSFSSTISSAMRRSVRSNARGSRIVACREGEDMVGAIWVKRGVNGSAADLLAAAPAPVQFAGVRHSLMHPVRTQQILRILHRGLLGLACLVPAARARGQAPNRPLDVHVIDETGMRVPAVLTLLLDRAGTTIRRGVTDSLGRTLLMAPAGVPLTVQVRHLGYAMAQRNVLVPLSGQAAR